MVFNFQAIINKFVTFRININYNIGTQYPSWSGSSVCIMNKKTIRLGKAWYLMGGPLE